LGMQHGYVARRSSTDMQTENMKHGHATRICSTDIQLGHAAWKSSEDKAAWKFNMNLQLELTAWASSVVKWHEHVKCDMDIEHGHIAWTCRIDMHDEEAALTSRWIRRMAMQHGHAVWICSMDMQHGHTVQHVQQVQHGNAPWTRNVDMQHDHVAGESSMSACTSSSSLKHGHAEWRQGMQLGRWPLSQTHENIMRNCSYAVAEQNLSKKDTDLKLRTA
jgi:hypothetical protein